MAASILHRSTTTCYCHMEGGGIGMSPNDTLIGRKNLWKAVVAVAALMMTVGALASVAYAATIRGTDGQDWGEAKDGFMDPPGCMMGCGKMIHGTDASDTIYGLKGWDYVGAYLGGDVVQGGPGMEIIQGSEGDDRIFGQMGHDHVFSGSGNDRIHLQDGKDDTGNVEQVFGDGGRDLCVVDEDPQDGVIVNVSCETLVIESVPDMSGATKIYNTRKAKDRGNTIPGQHYPYQVRLRSA